MTIVFGLQQQLHVVLQIIATRIRFFHTVNSVGLGVFNLKQELIICVVLMPSVLKLLGSISIIS